jgi:hypothetical protein
MLTDLADACYASGLQVITCDGWESRGYAGQSLQQVRGVLWHHTATSSARSYTSGMPTLSMLVNGRADLAGPLCNLGLGRGGEVYVVAAGVANHAGQGSAPGVPTDMGNHYLIGIEMESSGVEPWDWTDAQLDAMPRLGAALELHYLQYLAPEGRLQLGHYEYSSAGKIDPTGLPGAMDGLRARINAIAYGGDVQPASTGGVTQLEGFLMALNDQQQTELYNWVKYLVDPTFKRDIFAGASEVEKQARAAFADELLNHPVPWYGFNGQVPESGRTTTSIALANGWADSIAAGTNGLIASLTSKIDALTAAVAAGNGLSKDELSQVIEDSVAKTFGEYTLSLNKNA